MRTIDSAIGHQILLAKDLFESHIGSLSNLRGLDRLPVINSLVLTGPAFLYFAELQDMLPEGRLICQEIQTLEMVPEFHTRNDYHGMINLELDKLISPEIAPDMVSKDKIYVYLQAATDARLIYFGRIIGHIIQYNNLSDFAGTSPDTQRAVAFACYVSTLRHFAQEGWHPNVTLSDPIAQLIILLGIKLVIDTQKCPIDSLSSIDKFLDGSKH